jgi:hypothetical protein
VEVWQSSFAIHVGSVPLPARKAFALQAQEYSPGMLPAVHVPRLSPHGFPFSHLLRATHLGDVLFPVRKALALQAHWYSP